MESSARKRSWEVPLFVVGVGSVLGFSILRDATADPMLRNRYGYDESSCRCDYGPECRTEDGQWVGPWYAQETKDRQADDPGRGACRSGGTSSTWIRGTGQGQESYRSPGMVESGHRGGFGSTGRGVRAAS
jgi:hypothetical protein